MRQPARYLRALLALAPLALGGCTQGTPADGGVGAPDFADVELGAGVSCAGADLCSGETSAVSPTFATAYRPSTIVTASGEYLQTFTTGATGGAPARVRLRLRPMRPYADGTIPPATRLDPRVSVHADLYDVVPGASPTFVGAALATASRFGVDIGDGETEFTFANPADNELLPSHVYGLHVYVDELATGGGSSGTPMFGLGAFSSHAYEGGAAYFRSLRRASADVSFVPSRFRPAGAADIALALDLVACGSGTHRVGASCESDTRACTVTNGTGTETWDGTQFGACVATTCDANHHLDAGACLPDARACSVTNGTGTQTWAGATWGACVATACEPGYAVLAGQCLLALPTGAAAVFRAPLHDGTTWTGGGCTPATWTNLVDPAANATLANFSTCGAQTGWTGTGTPADPYRLAFDGADDYATLPSTPSLSFGAANHTVSAWIFLDSYGTYRPVVTKRSGNAVDFNYHINNATGDGRMASYNGANSVGSTHPVSLGQWHRVVWVRNAGNVHFFLDGQANGSAAQAAGATNGFSLNIGRDNGATNFSFDGGIADVTIWNRALDANEIAADFAATRAAYALPASCAAQRLAFPASADGVYTIDPDGAGTAFAPFSVYCDMNADGGDWALALRVQATTSTFADFYNPLWTNETLLAASASQEPMDDADAKFAAYTKFAGTNIRGCLRNTSTGVYGCKAYAIGAAQTLRALFANTPATSAGALYFSETLAAKQQWLTMWGLSATASSCAGACAYVATGINIDDDTSCYHARVRFGVALNNESNINTLNDTAGFGASGYDTATCSPLGTESGWRVGAGLAGPTRISTRGTIWVR